MLLSQHYNSSLGSSRKVYALLLNKLPSTQAMTKSGYLSPLSLVLFLLLVCSIPCHGKPPIPQFTEDNIKCLTEVKKELKDPNQSLFTWRFGNSSTGFICNFVGIQCWHNDDGKVLSVKLPGMTLEGGFPSGLKYCGSMTYLDLSGNSLSGQIPKDLCKWLPFLIQIDLSGNQFTGPIPSELTNCTYLNLLHLNDNQLSGPIPWELTRLERLSDMNFENNMLTGQIPSKWASNSTDLFQGNPGLCGKPISRGCPETGSGANPMMVAAFALYGIVAVIWTILGVRWWILAQRSRGSPLPPPPPNPADHLKARKSVKVHTFEKPIKKMILADLLAATDNFNEDKIIWCGRTGVLYKAELPDGSLLAVKRLRKCGQGEKEFKREMNTLGHLRHRNLVPLLGYCIAHDEERLLVYKYMAKGTLLSCLHGLYKEHTFDWPTRLKICVGIARGLAWLHHSCNPHVIHRNISSAVIFLDEEYEARISEFGLSRLISDEDSRVSISEGDNSAVKELGYDAPEQWRNIPSLATLKGDVYSFGVVAFEVITGLRPEDPVVEVEGESVKEYTLMEWIRRNSDQAEQIVQKFAEESMLCERETSVVAELMGVAFRCVKNDPKERPSMYQAYECLGKIGDKYCVSDHNDGGIPLH